VDDNAAVVVYIRLAHTPPHPIVLSFFQPRFRYGFSATSLEGVPVAAVPWCASVFTSANTADTVFNKRALVFGGVQSGGYTIDCNDLYILDLSFFSAGREALAEDRGAPEPMLDEHLRRYPFPPHSPVAGAFAVIAGAEKSSKLPVAVAEAAVGQATAVKDPPHSATEAAMDTGDGSKVDGNGGDDDEDEAEPEPHKLSMIARYSPMLTSGERSRPAPWNPPSTGMSVAPSPDVLRMHARLNADYPQANTKGQEPSGGMDRRFRPSTRGYHSATVCLVDGRHHLLVWGGLHQHTPTTRLEALDLTDGLWRAVASEGNEPSPRFGHTANAVNGCVPASEDQQIIVTGGSDGADLIRNGNDFVDLYVLTIVRDRAALARSGKVGSPVRGNWVASSPGAGATSPSPSPSSGKKSGSGLDDGQDRFVWTRPRVSLSDVPDLRAGLHQASIGVLPGRCHSAAVLGGRQIVVFGGGAQNGNGVGVIRLVEREREAEARARAAALAAPQAEHTAADAKVGDAEATEATASTSSAAKAASAQAAQPAAAAEAAMDVDNEGTPARTDAAAPAAAAAAAAAGPPVTTFRYDPYGGGSIALRQPAGDAETAVAAGAAQSTHFRAFAPRYLPADGRAAQFEASSPAVGGRDLLPRPMPLVSTASALIGHHWLIIGGFSNRHRERGEVWCLDLAASVSLAARRPQALRHGPHSHLRPETFLPPADGAAVAAGAGGGPVPGVGVARKAENVNSNVSSQLHTQYRHREDEYVDPWDDMGEDDDDDEGDEDDDDVDDDEDYDDDGEWHGVLGGHDDDDELGDEEYYDGEEGDEEGDEEDDEEEEEEDDDEPENAVVVEEGGEGKTKGVAGGGGAGK